jgi:hypothetical protein
VIMTPSMGQRGCGPVDGPGPLPGPVRCRAVRGVAGHQVGRVTMNRQPPRMFWTLTLPPGLRRGRGRSRGRVRRLRPSCRCASSAGCGRVRRGRRRRRRGAGRSRGFRRRCRRRTARCCSGRLRRPPGSFRPRGCPPAHLQAVDLGQHQVQNNETRILAGGARERGGAVRRPGHLVPRLREVDLDDVADGRVVVHDEDPRLHVRSGAPPRSLPSRPQMITPASVATNPPRAVRRPIVDLLQESRSRQRRRAPDRFAALTARFVPNWWALQLCPLLMQAVAIAISRRGMTLMKSL